MKKNALHVKKTTNSRFLGNHKFSDIFTRIKIYYKTIKQSKFLNSEHGRSMTEMLGVLAIIGVLSIGVIVGYRLSMNKLRANELINEINMRRVALYQQLIKDPDNLDMEMGDTTKHGYKISSALDAVEEDVFYISVETVPIGVCKEILRQHWRAPLDIYIDDELVENGDASGCGSNETPDMAFKFDKSGMDGDGETEPNTPDCPETTTEEKDPCEGKPLLDQWGLCYACDYQGTVNVAGVTENCALCSNRQLNGTRCILKNCPSDKPLIDYLGSCFECDYNGRINVKDVTENCSVCANRELYGSYCILKTCPSDKPLRDRYFVCYDCNYESRVDLFKVTQNCDVCDNRQLDGNYCVLK